MKWSRATYKAIAAMLNHRLKLARLEPDPAAEVLGYLINDIADMFEADNPEFNYEEFVDAILA